MNNISVSSVQMTQQQAGAENADAFTAMDQAICGGAVFDVSIEVLQNMARLETAWRELEARATHSFYLSWLWIGTWLRHLPRGAQPHVLTARTSNKIVGLAIICRRRAWTFGARARMRWLLNETGVVRFDRLLWIEHNNILVERPLANAVRLACLEALTHRLGRSDQVVLSGIDPELELAAYRTAERAGLVAEARLEETAWWIDFADVRQKGGIYRATLGSETRYAVSRAIRLYAERGLVEFRTMETISDALVAFDLLVELHQARWGRRGPFVNPSIRRFHEELIARGVPTGAVRVSRTLAGDQTIGVLYNFVHDGRVLNYQGGFLFECDGRLKPGLISHVLAIEDSIARGELGYDFMAGYAGHKPRLANSVNAMKWTVMGRDSAERRTEAALRRAKQSLSRAKRALRTIAA